MINTKRFGHFVAVATLVLGSALTSCAPETYYTVTFDANGGTIFGETMLTVAEGEKLPWLSWYPSLNPPPGDYLLKGWYREPEKINEWDFYRDVVTSDITLYAGWELFHSLTFYANGGVFRNNENSETLTRRYVSKGDKLQVPDNVIRPGHFIEGWYRDRELTDRWDFSTDVISDERELHAKWLPTIEGLTRENYPRVDGATSTRALNVMVACKLLGLSYHWNTLLETKELYVEPDGEPMAADGSFLDGRIATSQTYGAMMNLIEGEADIILRSTTASPDEQAAASAAGVSLMVTPIALDAFVFLKHYDNPVRSLTLDQIRKIYTRQITNWKDVGGRKAAIKAFSRPRNSGSEEALRELVMNGLEPADFPEVQLIPTMSLLFYEMEREPNGIGYIFKGYKESIMRRTDPVFDIDGVYPDATTIRNRTYPLTTEVYAIIRSDLDRGSMAWKLYGWLQTGAADMVLEECGFTPN